MTFIRISKSEQIFLHLLANISAFWLQNFHIVILSIQIIESVPIFIHAGNPLFSKDYQSYAA